ncbi:MAG TPA: hypothetical protein VHM25_22760 [Polyangiaceae bacterium]|nr:hypothetical protein [Polyangiaceae bacterium]
MLRLLTIALCALVGGCTLYTSCPKGSESNGSSCVPVYDGSAAGGSGPVGSGGGSNSTGNLAGNAPTDPWMDATGSLTGMKPGFGNICYLSVKPDDDELIAGLAEAGLWASTDGGETWEAMGSGKDSATITNRPTTMIYDPDHSGVFWEAGTYGAGVFKTTDDGKTFTQLGKTEHNEHLAIDLSDPKRKTMLAAGHEQGRILWLSTDGGSTWTDIGDDLPADATVCSYPITLDSETFLISCTQNNSLPSGYGIFRSTDAGASWVQVCEKPGWLAPLHASDGTIYWTLENGGSLLRSTDQGLSWEEVFSGGVLSMPPLELPSGRIVSATKDYLILSEDRGVHWRPVSSQLPFDPEGVAYSSSQKALFSWIVSTAEEIPPGEIQRFNFDDGASP